MEGFTSFLVVFQQQQIPAKSAGFVNDLWIIAHLLSICMPVIAREESCCSLNKNGPHKLIGYDTIIKD